jgi:drug/metabolite transporter (DMT)-like permease
MRKNKKRVLKSYKSILLIFLAAFLGGGISTFTKISVTEIPPLFFTLFRFIFALLVLLPFVIKNKAFKFNSFKKIFFISLLATANVTLVVFGTKKTTATISQMLYAAVPLIAGIFSFSLLKEKISFKKIFGIITGFIGVLIIILLPILSQKNMFNGNLMGNLIVLAAVCLFSLYSVLSKQFQKKFTPLEITMVFVLTTILIQVLLIPFFLTSNYSWLAHLSFKAIFGVAYVGIMGTGFYYLIYQFAIKHSTPVIASMTFYLQPIFAFLWAAILLGEKLTTGFIFGTVLAFIGVMLVTNLGKKQIYDHK